MSNLLPLAQQPYVSELLSFNLYRLHKEPELLRVDAEKIRRQMQEVAVGNYRAFIAGADALLEIREEDLMQLGGFGSIGRRWKQQLLELEVFSKRLELMQDEVNEKLQELRSMGD